MVQFPMHFLVTAEATSGINSLWSGHASGLEVKLSIPPEFEGPGGGFSPEDIYALALANCFIATFKVITAKSKLDFKDLKLKSKLTVDRGEGGVPWMSKIEIGVQLSGVTNPDRALQLLEKTSKNCMILNSTKTEKEFQFKILPNA